MKRYNKAIAGLIALLVLVTAVFTGCGQTSTSTTSSTGTTSTTSSTSSDTAEESGGSYDGTVKLGMSTWVGYGPFYVAREKGYFEKEGVNVELETMERAGDRQAAVAANQIQGVATTVDTQVTTIAAGVDVIQVLALDESSGGDGIVAKKDITSLQDLKGKTVALDTTGGASYFWFSYLLQKEGMSLSDMDVQNMSAGDAGSTFVAGKVDAAVTWQPWLTNAMNTDFGSVLISSAETPGIIVDSLAMRTDFVEQYPDSVRAINNAWFDALEFIESNPDEANEIMAEAMGMTVDDFAASLADVTLYNKSDNQAYFDSSKDSGTIYAVSEYAAELWEQLGLIDAQPAVENMVDGSFVS